MDGMSTLYEQDLVAWAEAQASALRAAGRARLNAPLALDWDNLAEEIEDLARAQRRELRSRLFRLLAHLLKWRFQPSKRTRSWRSTISEQRSEIAALLADSPSLRGELGVALGRAYPMARRQAAEETGQPLTAFPESCPFGLEETLDPDHLPDPAGGGSAVPPGGDQELPVAGRAQDR